MSKIIEIFAFGKYLFFLNEFELQRLLVLSFGILRAKTVNLSEVNDEIDFEQSGRSTLASQYNYVLKTFQTGDVERVIRQVFNILVILFYGGEESVKILIDRTNWEKGEDDVNILSIGLLYKERIYIPLIGEDLGYKGNSDSETRILLTDKLLEWWGAMQIPVPQFIIVGDREFIGEEWLNALARREVNYVIRLKANLKFEVWLKDTYKMGKKFGVQTLHRYMQRYDKQMVELVLAGESIAQIRVLKNEGKQAETQPYLYLITNIEQPNLASAIYRTRWKIETCFAYLKSKGLNLEAFNLSGTHKTDILMAVLTLVYALTVKTGEEVQQEEPPKMIEYDNGKVYPRVSTYKAGKRKLAKIRTFEQFVAFMTTIFEKILDKWQKLNQLHIRILSG